MRVGILTFPGSPSSGASLQMAALCAALEKEKYDVEIINYMNLYMLKKEHLSNSVVQRTKSAIATMLSRQGEREFQAFEKKLPLYPAKRVHNAEELKNLSDRYDFLICGSDQVWNPKVTGCDLSYVFDFCNENDKKISYAASFGLNTLPKNCVDAYSRELKRFHRISVREERGQEIVEELTGKKCKLVIDPSMLVTKEEWEKQMIPFKTLPKHYIAKFIFNYDESVEKWIKQLSENTGIPVLTIGGSVLSKFKEGLFTGAIGPQKWLYIIHNADYIVTDSFHGAAFSLIFEKQLFVSLASSTNSRLVTLCNNFGLKKQIIPASNYDSRIDYVSVRKKMIEMRADSISFLKEAMESK